MTVISQHRTEVLKVSVVHIVNQWTENALLLLLYMYLHLPMRWYSTCTASACSPIVMLLSWHIYFNTKFVFGPLNFCEKPAIQYDLVRLWFLWWFLCFNKNYLSIFFRNTNYYQSDLTHFVPFCFFSVPFPSFLLLFYFLHCLPTSHFLLSYKLFSG